MVEMLPIAENLKLWNTLVEDSYMGAGGAGAVSMNLAKDAPMVSTTDTNGFFNTQFGASMFRQLNEASVLYGALPQYAYSRNGFRAQTTRFLDSGAGQAENASLPATIKPTTATVTVGLNENAITAEYSERLRLLATKTKDDAADLAQILDRAKGSFIRAIDADMNASVAAGTAGNNIESIDRICSSYAEVSNCSITSGYATIYGLSRDSGATWADAQVDHNSGTTREIDDSIVQNLMQLTHSAGADPKSQFWYTGADTARQLRSLYQNQLRYNSPAENNPVGAGVEDGGKASGYNFGVEMGTLFGRPLYVAPTGVPAATGSSTPLSNLYLLSAQYDQFYGEPALGIKVLQAPMIAQTLLSTYPAHQKLGNKFVLYAAMQLECKRFNIQGKARDLKAAF
jgi:hypothetical protein